MTKPNSTGRITVLTSLGVNAVKTFRQSASGRISVEGYGRAKNFTAEQIEFDPRGRWLKRLRNKKHSFVVLGEAVDWKPGERKRRLSTDRDGESATLRDTPREWMPIDVDQIDFDPTLPGFDEGESFAYDVLDRLGLRGHWCVWHLTNSHGFFNKHRIRLWIRLARAATAAEMKAYAKDRWGSETVEVDGKEKPIVDLAVYQPQQPIYTGDPILIDVQDPTTRRVGYIAGRRLEFKVAKRRRRESSESDDGNVDLLREHGLYIRRLKPGQHCVRCPWEESHSGEERADDTFYFEPHFNGHDIPAFKCHHGSCEDRKWTDVLEFMGVPVPAHVRQTESSFSKVDDDDAWTSRSGCGFTGEKGSGIRGTGRS